MKHKVAYHPTLKLPYEIAAEGKVNLRWTLLATTNDVIPGFQSEDGEDIELRTYIYGITTPSGVVLRFVTIDDDGDILDVSFTHLMGNNFVASTVEAGKKVNILYSEDQFQQKTMREILSDKLYENDEDINENGTAWFEVETDTDSEESVTEERKQEIRERVQKIQESHKELEDEEEVDGTEGMSDLEKDKARFAEMFKEESDEDEEEESDELVDEEIQKESERTDENNDPSGSVDNSKPFAAEIKLDVEEEPKWLSDWKQRVPGVAEPQEEPEPEPEKAADEPNGPNPKTDWSQIKGEGDHPGTSEKKEEKSFAPQFDEEDGSSENEYENEYVRKMQRKSAERQDVPNKRFIGVPKDNRDNRGNKPQYDNREKKKSFYDEKPGKKKKRNYDPDFDFADAVDGINLGIGRD